MNGNKPVLKSTLCERIARKGFDKDVVIETVKSLLNDCVLFSPKGDLVKLTKIETNIHDF